MSDILPLPDDAHDIGLIVHLLLCADENAESEIIDMGLNHSDEYVRQSALEHQNCTGEQKVKYHLRWG